MKPCQRWDQSSWQNGCFSNTFISSIFPNDPPGTPVLIPKNALDFTKEGTMLPLQKAQRATWKTFGTFVTFGCLSTRGLLHLCNLCTRMKIIIWWKWLKFIKLMRIFPNLLSLTAKKTKLPIFSNHSFVDSAIFQPPLSQKKKQASTRFGKPRGFLRGLFKKGPSFKTSTFNLSAAASKGEETCSVSNCVRAESTRTWRLMDPIRFHRGRGFSISERNWLVGWRVEKKNIWKIWYNNSQTESFPQGKILKIFETTTYWSCNLPRFLEKEKEEEAIYLNSTIFSNVDFKKMQRMVSKRSILHDSQVWRGRWWLETPQLSTGFYLPCCAFTTVETHRTQIVRNSTFNPKKNGNPRKKW